MSTLPKGPCVSVVLGGLGDPAVTSASHRLERGEHVCEERLVQQAPWPLTCRMVRRPPQAPGQWELLLPGCHIRSRPSRTKSGLHFSSYAARDPGFLLPESDTSFRLDPSVTPHPSSVTTKDWFTAQVPGQRPPWPDLRTSGLRARLPLTCPANPDGGLATLQGPLDSGCSCTE